MELPVIIISAIAGVALLIVVAVLSFRAVKRRRVALSLRNRNRDQVNYAFVINPSKTQAKQTRAYITQFCESRNINEIEFIETDLNKDGRACAQEALQLGADVVVAVGGDGTVRTVASALSNSGHAMGIIPIGTGNLFARNMGIPVDNIEAALTVATSHGSKLIDVGRLSLLDDEDEDHAHAFLIIAGVGFDALMIDDTDPTLKKSISWLAYFVGGVKHLFAPKYHGTLTLEDTDGVAHTTQNLVFRTFMAGNCGQIPAFSLMPDAVYDDGILDFEIIDTSGGIIGWANLFQDVVHQTITGRSEQSPLSTNSKIDQIQGLSAEIRLEKSVPAQVDGDVVGKTQHLRFTVERQALCVRVPEVDA